MPTSPMTFTPLWAVTGCRSFLRADRYATTTASVNPVYILKAWKYHVMYGPAVRESSGYVYQNSIVPGSPPWHPNPGKSALLCVTTSGILKLLFSQNNNKIEETTVELENVNSSEDHITHASISSDRSKCSPFISMYHGAKQVQTHSSSRSQPHRNTSRSCA